MQPGPQHTEFLNALERWGEDAVLDAAEQVEPLMEHPGYRAVLRLLDEAVEGIQFFLKYQKVQEQAEYARYLGRITGIEYAQAAAESILIKAERIMKRRAEAEEIARDREDVSRLLEVD